MKIETSQVTLILPMEKTFSIKLRGKIVEYTFVTDETGQEIFLPLNKLASYTIK